MERSGKDASRLEKIEAFHNLSLIALRARSADEVYTSGVNLLEGAFEAALASIWITQPDGTLLLKACAGSLSDNLKPGYYVNDPKNYKYKEGRVANTRVPFISSELTGDEEFDQEWLKREG